MPKHPEYPAPDLLAENVALVLNLRQRGKLHHHIARQVAEGAVWWASNAIGRDYQSRYMTHGARLNQGQYPKWKKGSGLVNEHVIPRGLLVAQLLDSPNATQERVAAVLSQSFTCLVTATENREKLGGRLRGGMPAGWEWGNDPFSRYREAKIEWLKIRRESDA